MKSSQEMFDEIERGWLLVSQKENLPDLQKALNKQQELCAVLIQDKKKLIDELQKVTNPLIGWFSHLKPTFYCKN